MKETRTGLRREIVIVNDTGERLTSTLWCEAEQKISSVNVGQTIILENMETNLYGDRITLKSTSETDIKVMSVTLCIWEFFNLKLSWIC